MYLPKSQIQEKQYTNGNEYYIDGVEYVGYYYTVSSGEAYSGINPITGPSILLQPYKVNTNNVKVFYDSLIENKGLPNVKSMSIPTIFFISPTDIDYTKPYLIRAFSQRKTTKSIIEIDQKTYNSIKSQDGVYDFISFNVMSLKWQITGPKHDDLSNPNMPIYGYYDTNYRTVHVKEREMPGISLYLNNLSQFAI